MEKKIWSKPEMNEFAFAANEYVAACGDTKNWFFKFVCNLGKIDLKDYGIDFQFNWKFDIYSGEHGSSDTELLTKDDWLLPGSGYYEACDTTHYVQVDNEHVRPEDVFEKGWADFNRYDGLQSDRYVDVYIWRGKDGKNVHATTEIMTESVAHKGDFS